MAKNALATSGMPDAVRKELERIGESIRIARKRRDLTQGDLAAMVFVTPRTVVRLEQGDPGVSLAIFLTALYCLELDYAVSSLFAPDKDHLGINLDVRKHRNRKLVRKPQTPDLDF